MKARIVLAIVVTSCAGAWAVFNAVLQKAVLQKAVDIVSLPVERWMRRGYYRDDIGDNW